MTTDIRIDQYRTWDAATGDRRYVGIYPGRGTDTITVGVIDLDNPARAHLIRNGDPADRAPVFIPADEPTIEQATAAIMYEHAHQQADQ